MCKVVQSTSLSVTKILNDDGCLCYYHGMNRCETYAIWWNMCSTSQAHLSVYVPMRLLNLTPNMFTRYAIRFTARYTTRCTIMYKWLDMQLGMQLAKQSRYVIRYCICNLAGIKYDYIQAVLCRTANYNDCKMFNLLLGNFVKLLNVKHHIQQGIRIYEISLQYSSVCIKDQAVPTFIADWKP